MLYAIFCYDSEAAVDAWSKEKDAEVMTNVRTRAAAELYKLEIWMNGVRQNVVPIYNMEISVGRGSRSKPVDITLSGDPEISRRHLTLGTDGAALASLGGDATFFYLDDSTGTSIVYPSTIVVTDCATAFTADTDFNGRIDLSDLNAVRNNFGAAGPDVDCRDGDVDGNNVVGISDLNAVRNNFGAVAPSPIRTTTAPRILRRFAARR